MTIVHRFAETLRGEHRELRETLLELRQAFDDLDRQRARWLLGRAIRLAGTHFESEEETIFPTLRRTFGDAYVDRTLHDHERVARTFARLTELANGAELAQAHAMEASRRIGEAYAMIGDCDGISVMVEQLDDQTLNQAMRTRRVPVR